MIKSRHNTFGFWFFILISVFFFFFLFFATLTHFAILNLTFFTKLNEKSFYVMAFVFGFFLIFFLFLISAYVKNITIDTTSKTISIQNVINRRIKIYSFSDFDGLIDTYLTHRIAKYKTIGLIKDKKVVRYIDSFWYSNYSELRAALNGLNNLGTFDFGTLKSIRLLLRLQIID